ncbi:hypothetical protein [Endozoicomonas sp. 2B-B]
MTKRYVVELQQNTAFSNQSFSIKPDQRSLSYNPSDIADKNGFITINKLIMLTGHILTCGQ